MAMFNSYVTNYQRVTCAIILVLFKLMLVQAGHVNLVINKAQRQLLHEIKVVDFHQDLTEIVRSWVSLLLGKNVRSRTKNPQSYGKSCQNLGNSWFQEDLSYLVSSARGR